MTDSSPILKIVGLGMTFDGTQALSNLNLSVNRGDIYGLIGPNGAGKTTTFKIVATILRPTSGEVAIDGQTIADPLHILADLGEICNRVGIIEQGKLLVNGTLPEVLSRVRPSDIILLRVEDNRDE